MRVKPRFLSSPVLRGRRAGGRRSGLAVNLADARTAGPERREVIGHTQPRNGNSGLSSPPDRSTHRQGNHTAVVMISF